MHPLLSFITLLKTWAWLARESCSSRSLDDWMTKDELVMDSARVTVSRGFRVVRTSVGFPHLLPGWRAARRWRSSHVLPYKTRFV